MWLQISDRLLESKIWFTTVYPASSSVLNRETYTKYMLWNENDENKQKWKTEEKARKGKVFSARMSLPIRRGSTLLTEVSGKLMGQELPGSAGKFGVCTSVFFSVESPKLLSDSPKVYLLGQNIVNWPFHDWWRFHGCIHMPKIIELYTVQFVVFVEVS